MFFMALIIGIFLNSNSYTFSNKLPIISSNGNLQFKFASYNDYFFINKCDLFFEFIFHENYLVFSKFSFIRDNLTYSLDQFYLLKDFKLFSLKAGLLTLPSKKDGLNCSNFLSEIIEKGTKRKKKYGISFNFNTDDINLNNYFLFHINNIQNKYWNQIDSIINYFKLFTKLKYHKSLYHIGLNIKNKVNKDYEYTFISDSNVFSNLSNFKTYPDKLRNLDAVTIDFIKLNKYFCFQIELNFIKINWEKIGIEKYKFYNFKLSYMINGIYNAYNFEDGVVENPYCHGNLPALELVLDYSNLKLQGKNNFFLNINETIKNTISYGTNIYFENNLNFKILYCHEIYSNKIKLNKNIDGFILEFGLSF